MNHLAQNPEHPRRTKHIEINTSSYIGEQVTAGNLEVKKIDTNNLMCLQKPLLEPKLNVLRLQMGLT